MSTYLSVNNAELEQLRSDLTRLLSALEAALAAGKAAGQTSSWKGPAGDRYASEFAKHQKQLKTATEQVREGLAAVRSDIQLSNEAKAAERRRLEAEAAAERERAAQEASE